MRLDDNYRPELERQLRKSIQEIERARKAEPETGTQAGQIAAIIPPPLERQMKHLLLTTIGAVLLVGCGESQSPEPPTAKAPDISIWNAAGSGNIEAVKQHLAAGANVNSKDEEYGAIPLHHAAQAGHKEVVELLIAKGADVNAKNNLGKTPLDIANHPENPNDVTETADLLRKHGGKTGDELKAEAK